MTDGTPIARVENLTAAYGDEVILERVSFDVPRGGVLAILGGSGSGKSTLLKHMIGLRRPDSGRVMIQGKDLWAAKEAERRALTRRIGVTYQSGALFGSMSVGENVTLPLEEHTSLPPEARGVIARMKLALVGLEGTEDYFPSQLSGGMRKRAALARALALDPPLLFLDEPSAGLDPVTSAELDQLIRSLGDTLDVTVVIVTHELPSIFAIADHVIMLDKRSRGIVAEGTPEALRDHSDNEWVRQFFRREVEA